jgi:hypothetical protein
LFGVRVRRDFARIFQLSGTAEVSSRAYRTRHSCSSLRGMPAEYRTGLNLAIERGWLWLHESGTYVKLTQAGTDLFA